MATSRRGSRLVAVGVITCTLGAWFSSVRAAEVPRADIADLASHGQVNAKLVAEFGGTGSGFATLTLDAPTNRICIDLATQGIGAWTAVHVHLAQNPMIPEDSYDLGLGGAGHEGPVEPGWCTTLAPGIALSVLNDPDLFYLDVHTADQPDGALRAPFVPVSTNATTVLDSPVRAYDSREDSAGQLAAFETRTIDLDLPADAGAAVLTVTADRTSGWGYLTLHAAGTADPGTSNLNWHERGQTIASQAVVTVDDADAISITNGPSPTDVILDIIGHVDGEHVAADQGATVLDPPVRAYDSRNDTAGKIAPNETRTINLDLPVRTTAAMVTVAVDQTEGSGYLVLHTADAAAPETSNINWWASGQTIATHTLVEVDATGRLSITNGPSATHVIVDVVGHLSMPDGFPGDGFPSPCGLICMRVLGNPLRAYDSRRDVAGKLAAGEARSVQVPLPSGAQAAHITITVDQTEGAGYLAAYAANASLPPTSVINWSGTGQTLATSTLVNVDDSGRIEISARNGAAHVIVDVTGYVQAAAPEAPQQQAIDTFVADHHFAGMAVASITPRATAEPAIQYFTSGVPTVGSASGVRTDTQFEIGSESKTFTAGLLAALVAGGQISLDDPLQQFVPAGVTVPTWADNGNPVQITIGDLATHQAALTDEPWNLNETCPDAKPCATAKQNYTESMLWAGLDQASLLWEPGTKWLYSNWGWGILGTVLANLIEPGQPSAPYGAAVASTLTGPLGMSSTGLEQSGPRLATPYGPRLQPVPYWNNVNALAGGGGLISDITDMATWAAATLGYPVGDATPAVTALASTLDVVSPITERCQSPTDCSSVSFAMGMAWQLYPAGYHDVPDAWAFKDGRTAGMQSVTYLMQSRRIGITVLANGGDTGVDQLGLQLFQLLVNSS